MQRFLALFYVGSICLGINCCFGSSGDSLQNLHQRIGGDLMLIRKKHADMQPIIYGLLDKVGQLYTASKGILSKKNKYKMLFKKELRQSVGLNRTVVSLNKKCDELNKEVYSSTEKFRKSEIDVVKLAQEKEELVREKELLAEMKRDFEREKQELVKERDALLSEREEPKDSKAEKRTPTTSRKVVFGQGSVIS